MNFSFRTDLKSTVVGLTKYQSNGQIAFTDKYNNVYVTPYRPEIHQVLSDAGYIEKSFFVPFSNGEKRPDEYQWLAKIAEEECWAYTYEEAYKVATEKGIKPVVLRGGKYQIKEVSYYDDTDTHTIYSALTMLYLMNDSKENIGTYIIVDEKTLVVCDEYGRTFLLKAKAVVNDFINVLIDAGYRRTVHPERYIRHYENVNEYE